MTTEEKVLEKARRERIDIRTFIGMIIGGIFGLIFLSIAIIVMKQEKGDLSLQLHFSVLSVVAFMVCGFSAVLREVARKVE